MPNKLSISLVLSVLAMVVAGLAYLSPWQTARSGESACPALKEARNNLAAKNPNHPGLAGMDRAIEQNCPDVVDVGCGEDFDLEGFRSQCFTDTESCTAAGARACLEPSPTCESTGKPICGVFFDIIIR